MINSTNDDALDDFQWIMKRAQKVILFADIVESVRLIEADEEGTIRTWLDFVQQVIDQILPKNSGRFVKSTGDGMVLEFEKVPDAVNTSFAILDSLEFRNRDIPNDNRIYLRIGIDADDVIVKQDDIYGRGVNLAARLMSLAGPSEIVVSAAVSDMLTPNLDADVEDLGECYLRHYKEPIRAYRVGRPGPHPIIRSGFEAEQLAPTIAVIPFLGFAISDEHQVLGDVLAEEVISVLSHNADLNIISRLSTTVFKGREADYKEMSARLNADYLVSGVYRSADNWISLDINLVEARTGKVLWSDELHENLVDILHSSNEIIQTVITNIEKAVISRELRRSRSQPLPSLKSYTLLMSAIALMHRLSLRDFEQARYLLEALIERGGRLAIPQAWLANWHVLSVQQGWSTNPQKDAYLALECSKQALDADPECSLALSIHGFVHTNLLKQLDVAQESYDLAIQTNPNNSLAWLLKGTLHAFKDEGDQAVADTQFALKLSPLDPHRYFYDSLAASAYLTAGQYDRALEFAQKSLKANRTHTSTLRVITVAQWKLERYAESRKTAQELLRLEPALTTSGYLQRAPSADFKIGKDIAKTLKLAGIPV